MNSKAVHYIIIVIFLIFGIIQHNDPDFWLWGPIYFIVAVVAFLFMRNNLTTWFLITTIILYTVFLISYVPDLIEWIQGGMENIAGSMKAEEPHIELTREFFGLVICEITLLFYYWALRKNG